MNILIDFLVSEFSKYKLSKDELKDYFNYQLENSGHVENFKLLKADNEKSLKKTRKKNAEKKTRKIDRLNLKNIQNVKKNF